MGHNISGIKYKVSIKKKNHQPSILNLINYLSKMKAR